MIKMQIQYTAAKRIGQGIFRTAKINVVLLVEKYVGNIIKFAVVSGAVLRNMDLDIV